MHTWIHTHARTHTHMHTSFCIYAHTHACPLTDTYPVCTLDAITHRQTPLVVDGGDVQHINDTRVQLESSIWLFWVE